jgi:hypothetical protein
MALEDVGRKAPTLQACQNGLAARIRQQAMGTGPLRGSKSGTYRGRLLQPASKSSAMTSPYRTATAGPAPRWRARPAREEGFEKPAMVGFCIGQVGSKGIHDRARAGVHAVGRNDTSR